MRVRGVVASAAGVLLVAALAAGSIAGGQLGAWLLLRANERLLRAGVVLIGIALTIGLFLQAP